MNDQKPVGHNEVLTKDKFHKAFGDALVEKLSILKCICVCVCVFVLFLG